MCAELICQLRLSGFSLGKASAINSVTHCWSLDAVAVHSTFRSPWGLSSERVPGSAQEETPITKKEFAHDDTRRTIKNSSLDIHWREDGWIGLDPSIVAHPFVEEAKEYAEEVMA